MNWITKLRGRVAATTSAEYLPERVSILYRLSGTDVPIILIAAGITAFALWGYVGLELIGGWFIWLGAASSVRYVMARLYRSRKPPPADAENSSASAGAPCDVSAPMPSA